MERRSGNLIKLSAVLAIFISALGLFSLSAQTIEKRTKEIGIRKVNGASTSSVVFLLNRDFLLLVIISFIIAAPVSWFLVKKWLSEFAYKTDLSLWVFVMAGVLAFLVAFFTVSWQSWKAARKNPVDSLRYE
jgi:putative ABC transport system permease protein